MNKVTNKSDNLKALFTRQVNIDYNGFYFFRNCVENNAFKSKK